MSRLIFRAHPDMVRGAWVRGRRWRAPEPADEATDARSRPRIADQVGSSAAGVGSSDCRGR